MSEKSFKLLICHQCGTEKQPDSIKIKRRGWNVFLLCPECAKNFDEETDRAIAAKETLTPQ